VFRLEGLKGTKDPASVASVLISKKKKTKDQASVATVLISSLGFRVYVLFLDV
jgi:hypothetical protein